MLWSLERNAELIVGRKKALNVGITPRRTETLIAGGLRSLGTRLAGEDDRGCQREPTYEHESSSGHVISPFVPYHTTTYTQDSLGSLHTSER